MISHHLMRQAGREHPPPREQLSSRRWHIVQVKPLHEGQIAQSDEPYGCGVAGALEELGMAAYVPMEPYAIPTTNTHRHRRAVRPMFPGYVFAGFDPSGTLWHAIRPQAEDYSGIDGVVRLFCLDDRPLPIPEEVMQVVREVEFELACHGRSRKKSLVMVKVGNLIRIAGANAFSGLFGRVTEIDKKERTVTVELDLFGRRTPVRIPPEQVETV